MLDRIVTALEAQPTELPTLRNLAYGGSKVGAAAGAQGARAAARRRLRQRLRAHRDQFDDRGAHPRRPPRRARRVGRRGRPPAGFGRSAGARHRGADPRRRRHRARPGRDRRAVRPRRAGVGPVHRDRLGARRRGLVPHQGRRHARRRAATCSSAADPTTPSSAAARTSRRPRSKTSSSSIPHVHDCRGRRRRGSRSGVRSSSRSWCPRDGTSPDPDDLREHVRKSLRGSRTPDRVVFRDELPTNATGKVLRRELRIAQRSK